MAQLPEVVHRQWVKAEVRWVRELGFTAWPEEQLRAVFEDLIPFPAERAPSTGKPGRQAKHGRYCVRSLPCGDGAGQEGRP
jgi:hypothetical protein